MKTSKRIVALATAVILGTALASCGKEEEFTYSTGLDKDGFFKGVKASEIVTLPEYKGIDVDASLEEVTEEAIQEQVDGIMESLGQYEQIKDRAVEDGDTVNIDYVGSIDGVEFEGGTTMGQGTVVTIGVTAYIDDFLEQLIGHNPGETFNVEVTFPEDYGNEELNGKDAVFVTTINYIEGDIMALNDEVAKEYGFNTKEEMLEDIKDWLSDRQKFMFFTEIIGEATCESIPQSVLDYVINYDLKQQDDFAMMYYGMTGEEMILAQGFKTMDAYIEANMTVYNENALMYLAAQAIAELEGLAVTDEELENSEYINSAEEYGKPYLKQYMLFNEKLPDFIFQNGNKK